MMKILLKIEENVKFPEQFVAYFKE